MKHKSIICLALAFLVVFSILSLSTRFINAASSVPVLSIVPTGASGAVANSTTIIPAQAVGSTFSVDVRVDDYASVNIGGTNSGVSGASYEVTWNPAVLKMTTYVDGSWLPSQSNTGDLTNLVPMGQLTIGQIAFGSSSFETAHSASGSVSATLTFQVLSTGSTPIALQPQPGVPYLVAPQTAPDGITSGVPVSGTLTANAQYGSPPSNPSVYGPTAFFTPVDGSAFKLGSLITLSATLSQPGNDTQICNITNYAWSVEYLNGTTFASLTGENATFTANELGSFRIILIVTAPDVESPPNPNYVNTSSASAEINIVSSLQSVKVFITNSGVGGVNGGTYGPLQIVPTYALVTNSNASMPDESVLFTIRDANGSYYYRQGVTNESGIATIQPSFRLPNPDFGSPQTNFGTWSITASVNILGVVVNDTTTFNFNYLNGIENISIPASVQRGETLPIQLIINNQDLSAQWSRLSITIFDQADVPIGSSTITATQQTQNISVINVVIVIPSWAFTGTATAYLCLLNNSTNVPVAPETIANFNILS